MDAEISAAIQFAGAPNPENRPCTITKISVRNICTDCIRTFARGPDFCDKRIGLGRCTPIMNN